MDKKTKAKLERKGYKTYRFKDNPEEERFALAWEEQQKYGHLVDHLLSDGSTLCPPPASESHRQVANMVIQWLGTPVGQCFLRDLGYARVFSDEYVQDRIAKKAENLGRAFEEQMKKDPDSVLPRGKHSRGNEFHFNDAAVKRGKLRRKK